MINIKNLSFIIPCYNESKNIIKVISELEAALNELNINNEIIIINDGSEDDTIQKLNMLKIKNIKIINHKFNRGYGASIKTGIKNSKYDWIGIIDADGTYPPKAVKDLLKTRNNCDMIIGSRTSEIKSVPIIRRPAKWFIRKMASYITNTKIPDVNSGFRILKKEIVLKNWNLFPEGFSFTTTLTIINIMEEKVISYVPVDYFKRKGKSKIKPFKDTYNFFMLILRLATFFNPLKVFLPPFFFLMILSIFSLIRDIYNLNLSDTTVILFLFGVIILMLGLLADLINKRFP